jgi:hypothetical protein
MPISAPSPNTEPSVNLVDAFVYTVEASTSLMNLSWFLREFERIASECLDE